MSKQYGLIIPGKGNVSAPVLQRPSIFNDDSDSDNEAKKPTGLTKNLKRQDRLIRELAVAEDPTVFQYDELYDDMDTKRKESKLVRKDLDKKPKYISRLLQTAERRKRENERRIERQVQKEREEEGNEFKDKEEFVTSGYRKKLEELKELEVAEQREEYLETIGDVRKQGDLSGFYRHLYDQKVNYEEKDEGGEDKPTVATVKDEVADVAEEQRRTPTTPEADDKKKSNKRKYRKRGNSKSDDSDGGNDATKKLEHIQSNLDADSDFSIDSDSDEDAADAADAADASNKKVKAERPADVDGEQKREEEKKPAEAAKDVAPTKDVKNGIKDEKTDEEDVEDKPKAEKKPRIDIWKKRTVGVLFDEALARYFERKAIREARG